MTAMHSPAPLHFHRYGPPGPAKILLIHGLTGHGARWHTLASRYLPEFGVLAPDLIGHGRSSYAAPWTIDANVAALATLIENEADGPVVVAGHSFGGAVALHLAAACPDLVSGLVMLDPAVAMDGQMMRQVAEAMMASPDYTDPADAELENHLVALPSGRHGWRVCIPAMMSYWSELARDVVLPHRGTRTTLVRAEFVDPPYAGEPVIDALTTQLGADFTFEVFGCRHMVPLAKPAETAAIIRGMLG
jgi:lipase